MELHNSLDHERHNVAELQAELDDAKNVLRQAHGIEFGDYSKYVRSSKQFLQVKKTLMQKTEELTILRRRMAQYEPESITVLHNHPKHAHPIYLKLFYL